MNKKLKWLIISLVLLIVLLVILKKSGVLGKDEGVKVTAEKVTRRSIIETVNASGKIYPEIEVKMSPDISGEIVELNVEEGDSVKKGQVLARIYGDIYATQRDQAAKRRRLAKTAVPEDAETPNSSWKSSDARRIPRPRSPPARP